MPICGARAKRTGGQPCRAPAMANGRCRVHGGTNPGPPLGSKNGMTHGIYSTTYTEEEKALYSSMPLGIVDDELRMCRIRLVRALAAEKMSDNKPELYEMSVQTGRAGRDTPQGEKKFRRTDFAHIIDRLTGRIESLERTRAELISNGAGGVGDEVIGRIVVEVIGAKNAAD